MSMKLIEEKNNPSGTEERARHLRVLIKLVQSEIGEDIQIVIWKDEWQMTKQGNTPTNYVSEKEE